MIKLLLAFFVDPNPEAFVIPYLDISVRWYGILFTLGFILGYFTVEKIFIRLIGETTLISKRDIDHNIVFLKKLLLLREKEPKIPLPTPNKFTPSYFSALNAILKKTVNIQSRADLLSLFPNALFPTKQLASFFVDRLLWFIIIGTIVGARLGHVLFYDIGYYIKEPLEIFNLRAGGLASHGGALGALLSVYLYSLVYKSRFVEMQFLQLLDIIVIPTALVAFFIRIGNFINQEILGTPTSLPWGVIFGHPPEGGGHIVRHPVQLYEAFFYLFTFFLLKFLQDRLKKGQLTGLFFLLVFGSRFVLECFKEPQSHVLKEDILLTGQILSIPFILFGLFLFLRPLKEKCFLKSKASPL